MAVLDVAARPEFPMRAGISGKWIAGKEDGTAATSVLSNTAQAGAVVPRHYHEYEEIVVVEEGQIWVDLAGVRQSASAGQVVIIPPRVAHAWGNSGPGVARILFVWPVVDPFAAGKSIYLEGAAPKVS